MTIKITDKCGMGCLHCMENSTPMGKHMSKDTLLNVIDFVNLSKNTQTVNIGGGEPTEHPEFIEFAELIVKNTNVLAVTIISNGSFLEDKVLTNKIVKLMLANKRVLLQITSVKTLYPKYDTIKKLYYDFIKGKTPAIKKIKDRICFVSSMENGVLEIGRAVHNVEKIKEVSEIRDGTATKCFNMFNAMVWTGTLIDAIDMVKAKSKTSFCIPLIKENGDVLFGEYDECTVIVNLNDTKVTKNTHIENSDGPCGHCVKTCSQRDLVKQHIGVHYPNMFKKMKLREE